MKNITDLFILFSFISPYYIFPFLPIKKYGSPTLTLNFLRILY